MHAGAGDTSIPPNKRSSPTIGETVLSGAVCVLVSVIICMGVAWYCRKHMARRKLTRADDTQLERPRDAESAVDLLQRPGSQPDGTMFYAINSWPLT